MKITTTTTKESMIKQEWWQMDAKDAVLGRMCSKIANLLMGKNKPYYVSHLDCGDYVVVLNVADVLVTGNKSTDKVYVRHSNFPSGLKTVSFSQQMEKDPREIIRHAVKGMLPDNKLKSRYMKRLKLFVDDKHIYQDKDLKNISL